MPKPPEKDWHVEVDDGRRDWQRYPIRHDPDDTQRLLTRYEIQSRWATAVGWALILGISLGILFLAATGCSSVPPAPPAPVSSIQIGFCAWADAKGRELEARFGVPAPMSMLRETPAPQTGSIEVGGYEVLAVYTIGRYHRETGLIELWSLDWDGKPFSDEAIRHTWFHEWLHHYDRVRGEPPATGPHNDVFDQRIADLGLEDIP